MAGRAHQGIIDSEKLRELKARELAEKQLEDARRYQAEHFARNAFIVQDGDHVKYINKDAQKGIPLLWSEFEAKLKKLPCGKKLVFRDFDKRPGWRGVCFQKPDGSLDAISGYGKVLLNEYSTMILKKKVERDFSVTHLNHLDFPKVDWDDENGWVPKNGGVKPGWREYYEFHGEDPHDPFARGYRTVLLYLHKKGYATPAEIEKVFGRGNRKSWAKGMGHKEVKDYQFS